MSDHQWRDPAADQPRLFPVEISAVTTPDGRPLVLLQLPEGHALMPPSGARLVAQALCEVADEVERRS